jgi:Uma2 family endonuclease
LPDPAPELIIEVGITGSSLDRFPIYAAVGVQEIWRYDGERVRFHALEGNGWRTIETSLVLPPMTAAQAIIFIQEDRRRKANDWLRAVREWIRARAQS